MKRTGEGPPAPATMMERLKMSALHPGLFDNFLASNNDARAFSPKSRWGENSWGGKKGRITLVALQLATICAVNSLLPSPSSKITFVIRLTFLSICNATVICNEIICNADQFDNLQ